MVKAKKRGIRENVRMINKEGREVENSQELKEMWKEYFEELLNPNGDDDEENEEHVGIEESEKDLTWAEVEEALKTMKGGKAPGWDEVSVEMIRAAGIIGVQWLYRVLRAVWRERRTPEDWKKGIIVPIFKNGSRKICKNYRGVILMCHAAKMFEKILEKRIRRKIVEERLREEQYGFRPGRSTVDLIFSVRQLQESSSV